MASFQDILDKPSDQIKAPEALPVGSYLCIVNGPGEFVKIGKNNTDALKVTFKPLQAQPDVDQERLSEVLDGSSLPDKSINTNFFITDAAVYRLKDFIIGALGVDEGNPPRKLRELIGEIQGKQVLVNVGHRPSDDGKTVYMDIKGYARV